MLTHSLALAVVLFALGIFGVLIRRNAIVLFMCIETLMACAVRKGCRA